MQYAAEHCARLNLVHSAGELTGLARTGETGVEDRELSSAAAATGSQPVHLPAASLRARAAAVAPG